MNAGNSLPVTLVFSSKGTLVSYSPSLQDRFDLIGTMFPDLFEESDSFHALWKETAVYPDTLSFRPLNLLCRFTSLLMKDPQGTPMALVITLLEVSNAFPTTLDAKMVHMDRLAQIGQLAASIAHEIRNPLAGIHANVQVLSEMLGNQKDYSKFFEVILNETNRIETIIKDLLNYARQSKPVLAPTSITKVMDHVKTLVSTQLRKQKITMQTPASNHFPLILADSGQLIQVFLNCILNASQAMPQGGEINVNYTVNKEPDQMTVCFSDTGIGIQKDFHQRIFEPFFTTRAKGLGLGLSVVKKIMDDHQGKIEIESEEGKGTRVFLSLPLRLNNENPE